MFAWRAFLFLRAFILSSAKCTIRMHRCVKQHVRRGQEKNLRGMGTEGGQRQDTGRDIAFFNDGVWFSVRALCVCVPIEIVLDTHEGDKR